MTLEFPNQKNLQTYLETTHQETKNIKDKKILESVAKIFANFQPMGSEPNQQRTSVSTKLGTVLYWNTKFEVVLPIQEGAVNAPEVQIEKIEPELESTQNATLTNSIIKRSISEATAEKTKILNALMDCLYNHTLTQLQD